MQKRKNVKGRFIEVLEIESLMEVQGGADNKEYGTYRNHKKCSFRIVRHKPEERQINVKLPNSTEILPNSTCLLKDSNG